LNGCLLTIKQVGKAFSFFKFSKNSQKWPGPLREMQVQLAHEAPGSGIPEFIQGRGKGFLCGHIFAYVYPSTGVVVDLQTLFRKDSD